MTKKRTNLDQVVDWIPSHLKKAIKGRGSIKVAPELLSDLQHIVYELQQLNQRISHNLLLQLKPTTAKQLMYTCPGCNRTMRRGTVHACPGR